MTTGGGAQVSVPPAWQLPARHWSPALHMLPSLQAVPSETGRFTHTAWASQKSAVQVLPSSQMLGLQRRMVSSSRGGVAVSREAKSANSANTPSRPLRNIQPWFCRLPARNPRTSAVTSKRTAPVWVGATLAWAVAGTANGLGGNTPIDQAVAPAQSALLLAGLESTAQFQVAPGSVQALVRRWAATVLVGGGGAGCCW